MTPPPIPILINKVSEAAEALGDAGALELVRSLEAHAGASKLQLLILGSAGSGRAALANIMLQRPRLLPESPIPKAPLEISLRHGAAVAVETVGEDGMRAALPVARLRGFLTGLFGMGDAYTGVAMQADCDFLTVCDLRIVSVEAGHSPEQWRDLLAGVDYIMLVLNATALLSEMERRVVREQLSGYFGLQRVAIVVNQLDLVPEEERESLLDLVWSFLGPFEDQPAIIPFSAVDPDVEDGHAVLATLMNDMLERHAPLREEALRDALHSAVAELAVGAAREEAIYLLDAETLQGLRDGFATRRERLHGRIQRAQRRVDAFVMTVIKERLLRELEGFGEVFRRQVPGEVESIADITTVKKYLPGYMETVWKEFLHRQMIAARSALIDEGRALEELIDRDLQELLGDAIPGFTGGLQQVDAGAHAMHIFVMPTRGKHRAGTAVKALSYYGLGVFLFNPALGAASVGASQIIRQIFKKEMAAADRTAISGAAIAASRDVENEMKTRIEKQFVAMSDELKADIAQVYADGITRIEELLQERSGDEEALQARRAQLNELAHTTIPQLQEWVREYEVVVGA